MLCASDDCGLNTDKYKENEILNKHQEKYCVSRANIFTSGDTEVNPGPVAAYIFLQSRLP